MNLLLNNKAYSYKQIKNGKYSFSSSFEERTLLFFQQWLNGQQEFEQKTSGSTGEPKLIKITRAQMLISAKQTVEILKLKPSDVALVCIDTAFIGGKMMLVRAFEYQMKIIIIEPSSNPLEKIDTPFHFAAMVPLQFENTIKNNSAKLDNCKAIIIGGAPVSETLATKIAVLDFLVYSTYGMTETVSHIALKRLSAPVENFYTTVGDINIRTNDNEQLIIKGAVTNGKQLTTNDRVQILSPKTFKWLGRIDNVVNSGGIKIQLDNIETAIGLLFSELNVENRFFLAPKPDDTLGDKLVLFIESPNQNLQFDLLEKLKDRLEKYVYPKEIIYVSSFLETASGKVNKLLTIEQNT